MLINKIKIRKLYKNITKPYVSKKFFSLENKVVVLLLFQLYRPIKSDSSFSDVITYLESLPNYDSPELFGMTNNAEKACRELQAQELIETIVNVQPRLSLDILG